MNRLLWMIGGMLLVAIAVACFITSPVAFMTWGGLLLVVVVVALPVGLLWKRNF